MKSTTALAAALMLAACGGSSAPSNPAPQQAPPSAQPAAGPARPAGDSTAARQAASPAQGPAPAAEGQPRPYNRVITAEAVSRAGLFKTHRVGARWYFEIPQKELNRELLLVTRASRVPVNMGYG